MRLPFEEINFDDDFLSPSDIVLKCEHARPGADGTMRTTNYLLVHEHHDNVVAVICKNCRGELQRGRLDGRTLSYYGDATLLGGG